MRGYSQLDEMQNPWLNERAFTTTHKESETEKGDGEFADEKPKNEDSDMSKKRPRSGQGDGSLTGPGGRTFVNGKAFNGFHKNGKN